MRAEREDRQSSSRFLSLQEIADDLGESVETVRGWAQDGRLAPLYGLPNGKRKVLREDYECWLRAQVIDRRSIA
jgi:predicted site-specific integrase-resolvase